MGFSLQPLVILGREEDFAPDGTVTLFYRYKEMDFESECADEDFWQFISAGKNKSIADYDAETYYRPTDFRRVYNWIRDNYLDGCPRLEALLALMQDDERIYLHATND